jgi:hypothetical protein
MTARKSMLVSVCSLWERPENVRDKRGMRGKGPPTWLRGLFVRRPGGLTRP